MSLDRFRSVDIRIDKADHYFMSSQFAKGGDYNGRTLVVQITNGGLIETQAGITVNLGWRHESVKNSGLDPFEVVDAAQGIFEISYPREMLNPGRVTAVIQIIDGETITETKNFVIQVEKSPIDETSIVSSNSFTVLQEALIKVNSWNARIDAVEADFIERANNLDAIYPIELNSVKQQLEQKADLADLPSSAYTFKGSTTFAALPTTGNTLGDVRWATDTALNYAWTGAAWTPIGNGAFADGSVDTSKLADKAVTIENTDFAQRTNLFNYLTFTLGKKINTNVGVNNIFTDYATIAWALVSLVYNVVAGETYTVKILGEASPDINKVVFADATGKVCATLSFAAYATTLTFTVPENAIHMRINAVKSGTTYEQFMLVRGSVMPSVFVPHAKYTAPDLTMTDEQVSSVPKLKTDVTTLKSDVLALKTVSSNQWTGKKAVAYGCSITEMLASNGDSWEVKVKAALGFDKFYNRGKGGSTMSNIDTTGSMYIYVDDTQWDETATSVNASAGEFDGGVTVKWLNPWYVNPERIVTIPTDVDLILIDASTNDFYRRTPLGTLPFKSPWEVSQTGAIVYDKGTLTGAIGSLVTQLQARCPNAKIVFWGMPYNDGITAANGDLFFEYYDKIQDTVRKMGCEFIDVVSKMQVNINNLTTTFADGVHPATTPMGLDLVVDALVAGLKDIYPLPTL